MAVALYLRVSTEEQRERQSIITQQEFGLRYCALHQLTLAHTYADDGVSGIVPFESRPLGRQLLLDARQHKFNQLLVFKLDRIGRDTRLILNAVAELESHGIGVRSMTEEFDTSTATGRLMLTMLSGFAAHERELIRERSLAGTHRLAQAGTWLGGVLPYGYGKQGERSAARLVINQHPIPGKALTEVEVVETIYRMLVVGKCSCQNIADHLNSLGIPCASQGNTSRKETNNTDSIEGRRSSEPIWRPSQVRSLVINRTYMGQHVFGKRSQRDCAVIVRTVPAIVSEGTWESAQQVLCSNRYATERVGAQPFLLRGLIHCGACGLLYSGKRMANPQTDYYYRCNGRLFAHKLYGKTGQKCASPSLHGPTLERLVWADIEAFLHQPEVILEQLGQQLVERVKSRGLEAQRRDQWEAELQQKAVERDRVLALFRRGRIDDSTLDQQLDTIESESATLQKSIEAATQLLSAPTLLPRYNRQGHS